MSAEKKREELAAATDGFLPFAIPCAKSAPDPDRSSEMFQTLAINSYEAIIKQSQKAALLACIG
jgi:hypothetical protein